jgi:lipid A 3-O-deacylase
LRHQLIPLHSSQRNKILVLIIFSIGLQFEFEVLGQEKDSFNYQLETSTANDAFIIWENFDRYYTYGVGFKLSFKANRVLGLQQIFKSKENYFFSIGVRSEGYTPTKEVYSDVEFSQSDFNFERPFAGLLYGTFSANYLFKSSYLRTELYAGIMGPSAYSREIQDWIHENITDDDLINGWEFQIPDQFIINLNISAGQQIYNKYQWFDIYTEGEVRLGNLYIDATPLIGFRFGKFAEFTQSSAFGNGIVASKKLKELFIRSTFSATAVAFNGTAQGNIFNNDYSYAIEDLSHFHMSMSHGVFYSGRRFSASFDHIFTFGKVNKNVRHIYGRFIFNYRF